jgi:purine nucleosidase
MKAWEVSMRRRKVWLDTDIGTDVDDCVALALAICCPEIELIGVSTVYGDAALRARMAKKLLRLAGRSDVPVHVGCESPLLGERAIYWAGWEGEGILGPEDEELGLELKHAAIALCDAARSHPNELTVVAIGPLTNLAAAFILWPGLAQAVSEVVVMGGYLRLGDAALSGRLAEHNFACDPEAASIVFRSGAALTMVGLDVTLQVSIGMPEVERMESCGDPFRLAVADQVRRYLHNTKRTRTYMHDPLAVASVVRANLLSFEPCRVQIETASPIAAGASWAAREESSKTRVATRVDAQAFETFLLEQLTRPR